MKMSGEKNDLFTSLSSFLKLCQFSSCCSPYSRPFSLSMSYNKVTEQSETKDKRKMWVKGFPSPSFFSCFRPSLLLDEGQEECSSQPASTKSPWQVWPHSLQDNKQ